MLETAHTAIQWLSVTLKHYKVTSKVCVIYEDGGMYYIVGTAWFREPRCNRHWALATGLPSIVDDNSATITTATA